MAYDDRFDRVTVDRNGDPIGEEETVKMEMAEADETEKDETEDLEQEELESAVEDDDEEEEEGDSYDDMDDGQLLYTMLAKRELVTDGNWDDLTAELHKKWNRAADDLTVSDIRQDIINELRK